MSLFNIKVNKTPLNTESRTQAASVNSGANFIFNNKTKENSDIDRLYEEYNQAETKYNEAVQEQEQNTSTTESQINDLQGQQSGINEQIISAQNTITNLNSALGELKAPDKSAYEVKTVNEDGEEEISYPGYDADLQRYEQEKARLQNELNEANNKINSLNEQKAELDGKIASLNRDLNNIQNSNEVQQAQSEMETASANLEEAKAQAENTQYEQTEQENTEEELDTISINQLNEIAAKYTDKTELTEEEYQQIIAMEQLSQNFETLYGEYKKELDTEGWIDNAYNALKGLFGGITREMVEEEFDSYFKQMEALKNALNGKEEETKKAEYAELERKLSQDPANAQKYFTEYCGSDEKALEIINNWLAENTDRLNSQISYMEPHSYNAVMEDGEICIKEMKDGEEYFSLTLNEAADNFHCVFNPLEIIKNNDEVKEAAPSDFESAWKFYNGVEFDYKNIETAIKSGFEYTQINTGLATAYQMEEGLRNQTPETAFEVFKEQYEGDEDNAIEAFNTYYASLLSDEKISAEILNNKLTEIKAQKNDKGEIEFSMKFEPLNANDKNSLYNFFQYNGDNDYYEIKYNPEEYYNNMLENEGVIDLGYTNDLQSMNSIFWQINNDVAQNDLLQNRFKNKFQQDNGYSVEDAMTNYSNAREEAFGDNNLQNLLNEYIGDMGSYAQKISTIMSIGGIGLSFICPAFGYLAMGGVFADNLIDGVNMASNKKQGEDWQGLVKNTFKEASFIAIGMGINATAQSAHNALSRVLLSKGASAKLAATAGTSSELVIDGALSIGFDVLTTGELNLSGNSIGLLMDVVSGMRGYKAIQAGKAAADSAADAAAKNTEFDTNPPVKNKEIEWEARERTQQELQIKEAQAAQDSLIDVMQHPSGKSSADSADIFNAAAKNAATPDAQASVLKDFGFSDGNIKAIMNADGYQKVLTIMEKGIDMSYAKDIAILNDGQFTKCLELIDGGITPMSAKQLAKLDDVSIARAMELKANGIPEMSLADCAVLTGEQAKRIDNILEKHPQVSKYYVNELVTLNDTQYKNALRLIEQGKYTAPSAIEAVKKSDFDLHNALVNQPTDMLKEITPEIERELTRQAELLYKEYAANIDEIGFDTKLLFGDYTGEAGKVTAREKGLDSALKKLISKYENGKLKIDLASQSSEDITGLCRKALADAYGTRIQLESVDQDITKTVLSEMGIDYNDFVAKIQDSVHRGRLEDIPWEYKDAINVLKQMQTQDMVDAMIKEIYDGNLHIKELNNYGDDISSYFTIDQLQEIAAAYKYKYGQELDIITKLTDSDVADKQNITLNEDNHIATAEDYYAHYGQKGATRDGGYASTQGNVEYVLADGSTGYGELQIRGTELNKFADAEHIPYDIRKGKITSKDIEYSDVYSLIKNMSEDSYTAYNNYLTQTFDYLRLKELGIEIEQPKLSGDFRYNNGKAIPLNELQKLSYEKLIEMTAHHK